MITFDTWLFSMALFPILLGAIILILKRGQYFLERNLLGIAILISCWFMFIFIVIESNLLYEYPWMFRVGMPFYYLVPPFIYLYVYGLATDQSILKPINCLHLVPFFLGLIDFSQYMFGSDLAQKTAEIYQMKRDGLIIFDIGRGFVPAIFHYYGRVLQSIIYLFLQWHLIALNFSRKGDKQIFKWLIFLTFSETLMYAGNATFTIGVFYRRAIEQPDWLVDAYHPVCYAMLLAFFSAVAYLLFNPDWLYGLKFRHSVSRPDQADVLAESDTRKEKMSNVGSLLKEVESLKESGFHIILNDYLTGNKTYLRKRLTIKDVALEHGLSHHLLSAFINQVYHCNFNEFINGYRINHILDNIQSNPAWRQFSMEGIASESGFSSRSTFYLAFKNKTGLSPAMYIAKLEKQGEEVLLC